MTELLEKTVYNDLQDRFRFHGTTMETAAASVYVDNIPVEAGFGYYAKGNGFEENVIYQFVNYPKLSIQDLNDVAVKVSNRIRQVAQ